jgi:hypothetical protein
MHSKRRRALHAIGTVLVLGLCAEPASAIGLQRPHEARVVNPLPRSSPFMASDANKRIVLFGGYDDATGTLLGDTWTWDGSTWTEQHPTTSPSPRYAYAGGLAYDAATHQTVLYGGFDDDYFKDTWTWNGSDWTEQHPSHPPVTGDLAGGLAYDAATKQVVLSPGGLKLTVWAWDGSDWTEIPPPTSPIFRYQAGYAYDGARRRVVLFGGDNCDECPGAFNDTWTWDGVTWTQQHPLHQPRPRNALGMAYDADRRLIIMFGGLLQGGSPPLNDTWAWDGHVWRHLNPLSSPPARESMGMAWDDVRGHIVMFGGRAGKVFRDTWVWDGSNWTCVAGCP